MAGPARYRYCRCGTRLAADNPGRQCARCDRGSRDKLISPPEVPAEFWRTGQLRDAFAAQHMGQVARAYRTHPHHYAVYGPGGIPQQLLGQWLGLQQPQVSRFETGPPIRDLDTLTYWARVLQVPAELLWFDLPGRKRSATMATTTRAQTDSAHDPVLSASWNRRGAVEASAALRREEPVERRAFLLLTGTALTGPAHQWLIRDAEPLVSELSGRRISATLVDQLQNVITALRTMDDAAGGGSVFPLARQAFDWIAGLLAERSYDDRAGRKLHTALAELGQFVGWAAHDAGQPGLGQRYHVAGLHAAHCADDRPLGAHILACVADQAARRGRPTEAVTLIETALAGVRGRETPRLSAELHIRKAYALARLRDTTACTAAVSQARAQVERFEPASDPPWLYWVSPAEITAGAGDCLLELGQPERAAALLEDGIALFGESFHRDRQVYLTHLADARARPGKQRDLDVAAGHGLTALCLAENLASSRGTDCLRDLSVRMEPHVAVPSVRDFLERARMALSGTVINHRPGNRQ